MKNNCLIKAKIKTNEGKILGKTIQFLDINKFNTLRLFYRGSYVNAEVYT